MAELYEQLGLTGWEYEQICAIQGREPTHVELAVFSLMWSEHCGYKHSKPLLRRLPTKGERVLQGPGENAGIVDIGGGLAVAMKIESHNHPSAVEPYQGAATGVGGIIRDIFAMGARPICGLDSLRFGEIEPPPARAAGRPSTAAGAAQSAGAAPSTAAGAEFGAARGLHAISEPDGGPGARLRLWDGDQPGRSQPTALPLRARGGRHRRLRQLHGHPHGGR